MKVFIFGAGASQASQENIPTDSFQRSPLMKELFNEQYKTLARDIFITDEVWSWFSEKLKNEKIEDILNDLWVEANKISDDDTKNAELAIFGKLAFYLRWLFQKVSESFDQNTNVYVKLLKKIREKRIARGFISFNYDTLLDKALENVYEVSFTGKIETYLNVKLIKPHGSVNWLFPPRDEDPIFLETNSVEIQQRYKTAMPLVYRGKHYDLTKLKIFPPSHPFLSSRDSVMFNNEFSWQYSLPCLLPPLHNKDFSTIDAFGEKIIEKGIELLHSADEVFVIGYQAQDAIVEDMVKRSSPKADLHIISDNKRKDIQDRILAWSPKTLKVGKLFDQGFEKFVDEYELPVEKNSEKID